MDIQITQSYRFTRSLSADFARVMEVELLFYELVREPARRKISMHDLRSPNAILFTLTIYFRISLLMYSYDLC